jgi:squalene-hopene/tetraprenyl-beta-curcumene cyclase
LAVESLLAAGSDWHDTVVRGLTWLVQRIESDEGHEAAPIGFYFAKLWYCEALYPVIFSVSALGTALRMGLLAANQRPAESRAETGMTR